MPGLAVKTKPLVSKTKPFPADVGTAVKQLENAGGAVAQATSNALRYVQTSLNDLHSAVRNTSPDVQEIKVTDSTGKVVAFIGDYEFKGVVTRNYFSEVHIGDPLGTGDPTQAVINVDADGRITVGSTGWVDVLDPFGADAAWIGTQYDTLAVTGAAASSTTPLIRLTVPGHAFVTGDAAIVLNVGGVPNATGAFTLTVIDATHVDLQASVFTGAYTSGGTVNRLLHITGAANNGTGLIRLTVVAHGYESGDKVNVVNVGGVPNATGQWIVTVITADTLDLVASTFAGTYTSGGTCQRYFAGGLFQTIAVGPSFAGYKLRAFADGTLRIKDSEINLTSSSGGVTSSIDLDPSLASIEIASSLGSTMTLRNGFLQINAVTAGVVDLDGGQTTIELGLFQSFNVGIASLTASQVLDIYGYTGATSYGPLLSLSHFRGTPTAPVATALGDTLGGIITWGWDGVGESDHAAGVRAVATQTHAVGAHGTKVIIEVTANGSIAPSTQFTFDQDGSVNIGGVYKVAGQQVVGPRQAAVGVVGSSAGATYTATEQGMLNALKIAVNLLISRMQTHGLNS